MEYIKDKKLNNMYFFLKKLLSIFDYIISIIHKILIGSLPYQEIHFTNVL